MVELVMDEVEHKDIYRQAEEEGRLMVFRLGSERHIHCLFITGEEWRVVEGLPRDSRIIRIVPDRDGFTRGYLAVVASPDFPPVKEGGLIPERHIELWQVKKGDGKDAKASKE